jgi:hypothetical protein
MIAKFERRGRVPERGGTPMALRLESRWKERVGATGNAAARSSERRLRAIGGFLLCTGAVAVLMGLRPWRKPLDPGRGVKRFEMC